MNLIIQTCVPSYRLNVYKYIIDKNKDVEIISGEEFYSSTIKSDKRTPNVLWVKNLFFLKRKFLFQQLPWKKIYNAKSIIIEFNLRNVSFILVFLIRLFSNREIFLWGHAWSRSGENSKSEYFRSFFKKHSSGFIAYTEKQKLELEKQFPEKVIYAANNSIYYKHEMCPIIEEKNNVTNFIYVGRLVKDKKIMFLIEAFKKAIKFLPLETKLIIVGSGDELENIKNFINKNQLKESVYLLGHISDKNQLKELYSKSIASVSPGYVGLSLTQSLGFGVPMIISKDEPHSPELEAAELEINSQYFKTDNLNSLKDTLIQFSKEKEKWLVKRNQISLDCKSKYSIEKMADPFLTIFNKYE
ncbi:glycosyltransferase [Polaribacter haliotis]|uniref:Glycosyltransferase n=1 Tax=Polaribacter haliotis TaxID=1888915 RepID=A0A7L8ACM3_9FLAO|nr:glycosyltransferase [Polaribacter haliotis]QOD59674.1 glycosyltransferase [Polaribacter haliotis]